jgi:hypothetical protein
VIRPKGEIKAGSKIGGERFTIMIEPMMPRAGRVNTSPVSLDLAFWANAMRRLSVATFANDQPEIATTVKAAASRRVGVAGAALTGTS